MHIPIYAGLLSFNASWLLPIGTKLLSDILCDYGLILMYILNRLFRCLLVLHRFCFLSFSLFFRTVH